jgi:Dna[CI] antecedent, DciA
MQPARLDIERVAVTILAGLPIEEAAVLAWSLVCGSAIAARTQAVGFHTGALQVRVPDAEWRAQLESFSLTFMDRLSKLLGDKISGIEFTVTGCL